MESISNLFVRKQDEKPLRLDIFPVMTPLDRVRASSQDATELPVKRPVFAIRGRYSLPTQASAWLYNKPKVNTTTSLLTILPALKDIRMYLRLESYVSISVSRYTNAIMRRGWTVVGKNPKTVSSVLKRLAEISRVSPFSFDDTLREYTRSIVAYGNGFIAMNRADKSSAKTKTYKIQDKNVTNIQAIQTLNPIELSVVTDGQGFPVAWVPDSTLDQELQAIDVFYCTMDKDPGELFGFPYIANVINDLRHLRSAEELSLNQVFAYGSPILHIAVGDKGDTSIYEPREGGYTILDRVRAEVMNMDQNGTLVTGGDVVVKFIVPDSGINIKDLSTYFEDRVISGLGLSPVILGRAGSASKSSAEVQDTQFLDNATDYQEIIGKSITNNLITQICAELKIDIDQDPVRFILHPIDETSARAREIHNANLFNRNLLTLDEARELSGYSPLPKNGESRLYTPMFGINAQGAAAEQSNQAQPANQHGTQPAAPKYKKSSLEAPDTFGDFYEKLGSLFDVLGDDLLNGIDDKNLSQHAADTIVSLSVEDISILSKHVAYKYACEKAGQKSSEVEIINKFSDNIFDHISEEVRSITSKLLSQLALQCVAASIVDDLNTRTAMFKMAVIELRSLRSSLFRSITEVIIAEVDATLKETGIIEVDALVQEQ